MNLKKTIRTLIKIFLPLTFGIILLWLLYRESDFNLIWEKIRNGVRYDIILFSLLFGLFANIIRSFRWGLLIESLGEHFRMKNLIYAVLGNYAVNLVLPRVGEVWRCGVITRYEKIPFTKLFGTLIVDRVMDTFMVGLITLFIFIFNFKFFESFFARHGTLLTGFQAMFNSVWVYVVLILFAIICFVVFKWMANFSLVKRLKQALRNIWEGIKSVWLLKHKIRFLLQTVLIWVGYFFYFYITFYAFDFTRDLGVDVGLIAFAMSSIGVAVPVQGGIGVWQFMVTATLVCFGVDKDAALAFATVVFTVQTIWIGLVGLFGVVALPFANRDNTSVPQTAGSSDQAEKEI